MFVNICVCSAFVPMAQCKAKHDYNFIHSLKWNEIEGTIKARGENMSTIWGWFVAWPKVKRTRRNTKWNGNIHIYILFTWPSFDALTNCSYGCCRRSDEFMPSDEQRQRPNFFLIIQGESNYMPHLGCHCIRTFSVDIHCFIFIIY